MDTGGSIGNTIFLTKRRQRFIRYTFVSGDSRGAYAIRPYPDGRMDTGGSISDPVIPVKGFVYLWRVSHSLDEGRSERRQAFLFYQRSLINCYTSWQNISTYVSSRYA